MLYGNLHEIILKCETTSKLSAVIIIRDHQLKKTTFTQDNSYWSWKAGHISGPPPINAVTLTFFRQIHGE